MRQLGLEPPGYVRDRVGSISNDRGLQSNRRGHDAAKTARVIQLPLHLDESAEGLENYENLPKNESTNYEVGTIHDATGENISSKCKGKRAADATATAGEEGSMAAKLASHTKAQLAKAGKIDLSLQGVSRRY